MTALFLAFAFLLLPAPAAPLPPPSFSVVGPGIRNRDKYFLPLGKPITLAAAISQAGGFNPGAKRKEVCVIRQLPGKAITFRLDATNAKVFSGFQVQNGDEICVPSSRPPSDTSLMQLIMRR